MTQVGETYSYSGYSGEEESLSMVRSKLGGMGQEMTMACINSMPPLSCQAF